MASILRAPAGASKGVVTFTTPERDLLINTSPATKESVRALKSRWVIGLHHNWHDFNFQYDPLFDFSMAGEGDLREKDNKSFERIPMDACNFVPDFFAKPGTPFWDVLYVARAVVFKRLPEFFQCIRTLYDAGHKIRVLCICPVPPYSPSERATSVFDAREQYEAMFSKDEQELFTLLTLDYGYPFPLDLQTLAHFYSSSRVCVHFSDDERRARVAAYGWAAGMPMVCMPAIASLLPAELQRPPLLFQAAGFEDFPAKILEALRSPVDALSKQAAQHVLLERETVPVLRDRLDALAGSAEVVRYATKNLAFRLGRHHEVSLGKNSVDQSFDQFVSWLAGKDDAWFLPFLGSQDPELDIASASGADPARESVRNRAAQPPSFLVRTRALIRRFLPRMQ